MKNVSAAAGCAPRRLYFVEVIFGQKGEMRLESHKADMLYLLSARNAVVCLCWSFFLAISTAAFGQTNYYTTNGTEYAIIGSLPGDQVWPDVAITTNGGYVVWQDNITDGNGWGISARRLDGTLSGTLSTFRVNQQAAGNQEYARVAMLKNGGAVFVWQGGQPSNQRIYAQFVTPTNTFLQGSDILVNTFTNNFQINPAVAVLNNSNVVVVWGSFDEAGSNSLQDVYGQILSPTGQKVGGEFLVNQFTNYNQRTPTVAALTNGGFVVAWVSEQERTVAPVLGSNSNYVTAAAIQTPSVDIYARLFTRAGVATSGEFLVDTNSNPCATPAVAVASDGSFMVVWAAHDMVTPANGWDIYARTFTSAGAGGAMTRVNTYTYGDQYTPRISSIGLDYMVTWTSLAQDGSREGVFAQFVHNNGSLVGGEFLVNTTTISQQMQASVASDRTNQFLVVWTSYTGTANSFDLYGQRYANIYAVMPALSAPFVWAPFVISNNVYQPQLSVSWPLLLGLTVSNYEVYVDGAGSPMALVTSNQWTMTAANGLKASSTHSFQVGYVITGNHSSPLSPSAGGTTWSGKNWGGIPYEWMTNYYGGNTNLWPPASSSLAAGGPTVQQVFLSGGNPLEPSTWLQTQIASTPQGLFLSWNTQPGWTYQLLVTTNFTSWSSVGAPRFAAGTNDSIYVGGSPAGYYRVMLLRN